MAIKIPDASKKGLERLISFDDALADKFYEALREVSPRLGAGRVPEEIAGKIGLPVADTREVTQILLALYSVRYEEVLSVDELIDDLRKAAERMKDPLTAPPGSWDACAVRLRKLLSLDGSFGVIAKALCILHDYPRHFHSARILTDARPVFQADAAEAPTAYLINHVLKIGIHEDGEDGEWFLALNSRDLEKLRGAIDRAIVKEKSLATALRKTSATILEWED